MNLPGINLIHRFTSLNSIYKKSEVSLINTLKLIIRSFLLNVSAQVKI